MNKFMKYQVLGMCSAAVLGVGQLAYAATETTNAVVDILQPVTITENLDMQFGKVAKPSAGSNVVTVSTAGVRSITGGGNGALASGGTVRAADYTVTATAGETMTISAVQNTGQTGLSLSSFTGNYDGNGENGIDPGDAHTEVAVASATLLVGADLTVDPTAVAGINTLTFDLMVDYQ